jgi:hypothetical protein
MAWPCSRRPPSGTLKDRRPSRARRHLRGRNGAEARCPSSDGGWCSSARCASLSMAFPLRGSRSASPSTRRVGGHDEAGREALLKYILRPAVAQERVTRGPAGLVRITLKKPFSDGTVAVDLDPLSLLSRLAASVPAPRLHTVRYDPWKSPTGDAGVLASASKLRARLAPKPAVALKPTADVPESPRRGAYRPWAELLKRTFGFDVLTCPCCSGRMKLLALVTDPTSVADALRDPRRGSTCGASASRPTCRTARPLRTAALGKSCAPSRCR